VHYAYDPYGRVVAVDDLTGGTPPHNALGHQGLFYYRLDAGPFAPPLAGPDPVTGDLTTGLFHNRNRWYSPELGRFVSRDPNDTAMPLLLALLSNGKPLSVYLGFLDMQSHYADGMSLYAYQGANPLGHLDGLGLAWGMEDDIDDLIADRVGHALYALGTLNEGAKYASLGLRTAVGIAGSLLPGAGLYDAFKSVQVIASGRGGFWDAVNIATAAFPIAKGASKLIGLKSLFQSRNWRLLRTQPCNCFAAGTPIDTPFGAVAIETVEVGDYVLTVQEGDPGGPVHVSRVTRVFRDVSPVMLWVTLSSGAVLGITPGHELWTLQDGWMVADELECGDTLLTVEGQLAEVVAVDLDSWPTRIYNLEVEHSHTYFADGVWVHNNSCSWAGKVEVHHLLPRQFADKFRAAGLEIEDFKIPLERGFHGGLHRGKFEKSWNGEWKAFFDRYERGRPPTDNEILTQYADMFRRFFLE
jgi:hypothetical protein